MGVLLGRHGREYLRARGIVFAQAVGEVGVDAPVLLLVGDRQRENFALREVVEIAHRRDLPKIHERRFGKDRRGSGSKNETPARGALA